MSYSETLVEHLIPAIWDRTYAWGMQNPASPDVDMPKAKYKSPKEATTFWTHLIDIRIAWARAPITVFERRAILLHYGLGMTQEEIAENQQVSQRAIGKRLTKGIDTLTDWLNRE